MSKPIKITLFHMTDCIHCDNFEPVWKNLSSAQQKNIAFADYERQEMESLGAEATINGKVIAGFPTIKVNVMDREYDYKGERSETSILTFVRDKLSNRLNGVESEKESERSEMSVLTDLAGGDHSSTEQAMRGGADGEEGDGEEGETSEVGAAEATETTEVTETTEEVDLSTLADESSPNNDSPKASPKDDSPKASPKKNIFSTDESEPANTGSESAQAGGDFRMSEFDRLLMKEINVLSEIPRF